VLLVYHLVSDGDFSFLLTLSSLSRVAAFCIVLYGFFTEKTAQSLSLKTMQLHLAVHFLRLCSILFDQGYLPYDSTGDWLYQSSEVVILLLVGTIVFMVMKDSRIKQTYELTANLDVFGVDRKAKFPPMNVPFVPTELGALVILVPCLVLAAVFHPSLNNFFLMDVAWTAALYTDSLALLPQLYLLHKRQAEVRAMNADYIFCLAVSCILSVIFWMASYAELNDRQSSHVTAAYPGYLVVISQLVCVGQLLRFMYLYVSKNGKVKTTTLLPLGH